MTGPRPRGRATRRQLPIAAVVCAAIIAFGAWIAGWWIVPVAALIAGVFWWDRPNVAVEVMWGGVAGWLVLLLIDSLHGRTWALARAAGGALFLPWGLLIPVTLLFAAGLAWSVATLSQAVCVQIARRV
jgi:hypothetical protein